VSKSPKNDNRKKRSRSAQPGAQNDNRPRVLGARARHPWADAVDGIDFGPAVAAVADLAGWALDLAAADVADWSEGARRVRTCRRYVLRSLRGQRTGGVPYEDILFTAGLLARIFESEIGLGMSEVVAVLDKIGLPTEVVPMMPRVQPHARIPLRAVRAVEVGPRPPHASAFPMSDARIPDDFEDDPPCDSCGHRPRYRNAA
jgi:hypothetical protein